MQLNELLSNTAEMTGFHDYFKGKGTSYDNRRERLGAHVFVLADLEEKFQVPLYRRLRMICFMRNRLKRT